MLDRNGKELHEGELVNLINCPDDIYLKSYWAVFDCLECRSIIQFVLINCVSHEIKVVSQAYIERAY